MSATITYRKLDATGEPIFGNGAGAFVSDIDAVAQAISTRLKLLQGEWWENLNDGTPLFQSMLAVSGSPSNLDTIALILKQRILGTPYVLSVDQIQTSYKNRAFSFACRVQTQFGSLSIS